MILLASLVNGDLVANLEAGAITAIQDFVSNGGVFAVFEASANSAAFLNQVFGYSTVAGAEILEPCSRGAGLEATIFAHAPTTLASNPTSTVLAGLPVGATTLYDGPFGDTCAAVVDYGGGRVGFFAWDWDGSAPRLYFDDGWHDVLLRLIRTAPAGAHTDGDFDRIADVDDVCPGAIDFDQADADSDGVGDACTCGDVDDDGVRATSDVAVLRGALTGSSPLGSPPKCSVIGSIEATDNDGNGVRDDCDVLDWVVLERDTSAFAPGAAQVCEAAQS